MTVKKDADKKSTTQAEESQVTAPKEGSLRDLFRYASKCDVLLLIIGSLCAIVTGCGMPFMALLFAFISQSFVDVTSFLSFYPSGIVPTTPFPANTSTPSPEIASYSFEEFNREIVKYSAIFYGLGGLMFITATTQVTCYLRVCENMVHRIRADFFRAVLRQDISWFDKNQSGTLTSKLFDNIERIQEGTGDKVAQLIQQMSQFICGLIVAFVYSWKLTLIMISLTPVMIISSAFIGKMMARAATHESEKYMKAGAIAEEVLTSIRTVIAFNGQKHEVERYSKALLGGKRDSILKSFYMGFGMFVTLLVTFGSYGLAFWIGLVWVHDGEMNAATVMTVFFSVLLGSMALGQAGPNFGVVGTAKGCAGAVFEIIDREPEIDAFSESGDILSQVKGDIDFKDVHFSYESRPDIKILNGVSFKVKAGETVALVGSSGCGKSTSVSLLLRYYNTRSGQVTLDGHDISTLNLRHLRQVIGVVSQEPILFNCSIEENIRMGKDGATEKEVIEACNMSNAHDFISKLPNGYRTHVGERGTQLSGGQKQRIAIARTLIGNPKILLLDEATSALDAESESIVQAALDKAGKGRTMIIVAHRLSTIRNADKIIALKAGNIEEMGSHAELMAKQGLYYDLVTAQQFTDSVDSSVAVTAERKVSKVSNTGIHRHKFERQSTRSIRSRLSSFASGEVPFSRIGSLRLADKMADAVTAAAETKDEEERLKAELKLEGARESNFLQIMKCARPEWCMMAAAAIFSCAQGAVFPLFSLLFTEILNTFSKPPEEMLSQGRIWSIMFLVLGLVQGGTALGSLFLFGWSAEKFTIRLRSLTFKNVLRQDVSYFDQPAHASGKICTRLASDAPNIKAAMDYRLGSLVQAFAGLVVSLIIAFIFSWKMALLALGIFPFGLIGEVFRARFENSAHRDNTKLMEEAGKVAMEAIEHVRTVQALTLERIFIEKFDKYLEEPHRTSLIRALIQGPCYGLANSIYYVLYASSFLFGSYLVRASSTPPMNVLRSLFAIGFSSETLGQGALYIPGYRKARTAAGLLFKMLFEEPKIDSYSDAGVKPLISGNIDFNDVHFAYPQRPDTRVLKGLQLKVQRGKTLALVGPSGCGKSTVIGLLERFYDPLDGTVIVDGSELKTINPVHMRKSIALVSQEPTLFDCSIRENIIYGLTESVTEEKILQAGQLANIHSFVSGLPEGYNTRVGEKGTQLSGGQKQRIAIARALVRDPRILLLDEATSALDTESEKIVQEALDRAREGRTCIVIAHRLSTIVNADVIAVVRNGVVIEQGSHQELLAQKGAYFALTEKQNLKP